MVQTVKAVLVDRMIVDARSRPCLTPSSGMLEVEVLKHSTLTGTSTEVACDAREVVRLLFARAWPWQSATL